MLERVVCLTPTGRAGAVSSSQGRRLVEKEKLGVLAKGHDLARATLELKQASDPGDTRPSSDDMTLVIMETASIAH
jgi:hypothetical protein